LVSAAVGVQEWRAVFYVGGALTLLVLPAVIFLLPESLKFLALRPKREPELRASLARLLPSVAVPEDAVFVLNEAKKSTSIDQLFTGKLLVLTPTLWLTFMSIMLVNFFMNSWLVVLLTDVGFSPAKAATALSLYQVGGIFGGLLMGIALDRVGPVVLGLCSLVGCVSIALIGVSGISPVTYVLVGLVGFGVLGTQVGLSAAAGLLYPTAVRSKGAGFAHSVGRIGAISGPLLAGALIANNSSVVVVFLTPSVPFAVAAICGFILTWIWTGTARGHGFATMEQRETAEQNADPSRLAPAES
jgi:AAHS family 4-hydroxybenzoate transporter-like MFS transporter